MMKNLIDSHFHLDMYRDHALIFEYLNASQIYTLCMTNSPGTYVSCRNLYNKGKYVKFALGFHPLNECLTERDFKSFIMLLPDANYIGEIGLDYSKKTALSTEKQKIYFSQIVERGSALNKLMSIHIRKAETDATEIIGLYKPKKCIIHWFTGNAMRLQELLDLGCFFSINANMALKNPTLINQIPKDKVLIESDGPYSKVDGKPFRPEYLLREYEIIAKTINEPNLIELVYGNFDRLLRS